MAGQRLLSYERDDDYSFVDSMELMEVTLPWGECGSMDRVRMVSICQYGIGCSKGKVD